MLPSFFLRSGASLGGDVDLLSVALEAQTQLYLAVAVPSGRIEVVDTELDRATDYFHRIFRT